MAEVAKGAWVTGVLIVLSLCKPRSEAVVVGGKGRASGFGFRPRQTGHRSRWVLESAPGLDSRGGCLYVDRGDARSSRAMAEA